MKKILMVGTLLVGTVLGYSQGTIILQNTSATYAVSTNTAALGSGDVGTSGATANVANSFYYALLFTSYSAGTTTANYTDLNFATWTLGEYGTNAVTGGIKAPGGTLGAPITGWGAPTGSSYNTGSLENYVLVGWSSNLGSTWSQVEAEWASGVWAGTGFFGYSPLADGYAGGGPNTLPAPSVFGNGVNADGIPGGFNLYSVGAVPEPATMALAALGGASLLLFRRKK